MKVVILDDAHAVADYGAELFREQLRKNPASVFGLATGSTPLLLYKELIESNRTSSPKSGTPAVGMTWVSRSKVR